jgi:hypothetical protein
MRQECPEGFIWDCCNEPGDEAGCKLGKHEADPEKSRREAGSEPSDTSISDEDEDGDDEEGSE